jgi:hypothetical protein
VRDVRHLNRGSRRFKSWSARFLKPSFVFWIFQHKSVTREVTQAALVLQKCHT